MRNFGELSQRKYSMLTLPDISMRFLSRVHDCGRGSKLGLAKPVFHLLMWPIHTIHCFGLYLRDVRRIVGRLSDICQWRGRKTAPQEIPPTTMNCDVWWI